MTGSDPTIVAIATPPGEGGVGIVRLSGPDARRIGLILFRPGRADTSLRSHRMVHGSLRDPETGAMLDDCLVCFMAGPRSYTGEDVVEMHCHGSPVLLQEVVACCLRAGARPAGRGEFTLRAFLNGRLDLAQAESVVNLVRARTPTAAQVAALSLTGALARRLEPSVRTVTGALAYLEATIDFVEEGLPEQHAATLASQIDAVHADLQALLARARHGAILRDGVRVVLAGKPNVGKSSLLNALLRRDRAIVTSVPGTTRDTLEEPADIHGLPMYLIDTAGLTESSDPVERIGVERSRAAIEHAAIVVLVVDCSQEISPEDLRAAASINDIAPGAPVVLVENKCDLAGGEAGVREHAAGAAPAREFTSVDASKWSPVAQVRCSAVTGEGLAGLEDILAGVALGGEALRADETVVENARQAQALREAVEALASSRHGIQSSRPVELVCIDLRRALDALGSLTGLNVGEAILDRIFSEFCIGK